MSSVFCELKKIIILELAEEESDSEELSLIAILKQQSDSIAKVKPCERSSKPHTEHFVEEVVPRYKDIDFRRHFRMYRDAFEVSNIQL